MEQLQAQAELKLFSHAAENCKRFEQRFNLYTRVSGATEKSNVQKITIFLNTAGAKALDICNSMPLSQAEQADYETVLRKFKEYCTPKKE